MQKLSKDNYTQGILTTEGNVGGILKRKLEKGQVDLIKSLLNTENDKNGPEWVSSRNQKCSVLFLLAQTS